MAFQNQRNIFGPLAEGLRGAAQAVGAFFAQKAEREWQQGVDAIAQARNKLAEIEAAEADPDFAPDDNQVVFLNRRKAALEAISGASPREAAVLWAQLREADAAMGGGFSTRNVIQAGTPATPQRGGRGGVGRPAAPGEVQARPERESGTPSEVSTVTQAVPFGQMFSELQREAALRERGYQESLLQSERDFILTRDENGQQHEVRLAELRTLADLRLQAAQHESDLERDRLNNEAASELTRLAHELGMSEKAVEAAYQQAQTRLEQGLLAEREVAAREGALDSTALSSLTDRANDRLAVMRDVTADPSVRQQAFEEYKQLIEQNPEWARRFAFTEGAGVAALEARDSLARQARMTELDNIVKSGEATDLEIEKAREELGLLRTQVRIAGQTVQMNELVMDGQRLKNETDEFNLETSRWKQGVTVSMTSQDYIQRAMELGNSAAIQALIDEYNNPGTNPHLRPLLEGVTLRELNNALGKAVEVENIEGRKRAYAEAEIDQAFRDLERGDLQGQLDLVERVSMLYTPEEIENDATLQQMVREGKITQSQFNAMQTRSSFRALLEQETVNGPKISRANDRLVQYASKRVEGEDIAVAEAGLRSTLEELVELGAMNPEDVEGIVALYKQGWSDAGTVFDQDEAYMAAQTALLGAQTNKYRADSAAALAAGNAPPALTDELLKAADLIFKQRKETLDSAHPGCSESLDIEATLGTEAAGIDCGEYRSELADLRLQFEGFWENLGIIPKSPTANADQFYRDLRASTAEDYGEDAADAQMLFLAAKDMGLDAIDTFTPGVTDPVEWMNTWGRDPDSIAANYQTVIDMREERRLAVEDERRDALWSDGAFLAAYNEWKPQIRPGMDLQESIDFVTDTERLAQIAQQFGLTPAELGGMFSRRLQQERIDAAGGRVALAARNAGQDAAANLGEAVDQATGVIDQAAEGANQGVEGFFRRMFGGNQ